MERARQQAQSYARNLPPDEIHDGRPPFLVVVDVGHSIELYSEFTRSGGNYMPFPDPRIIASRSPICCTPAYATSCADSGSIRCPGPSAAQPPASRAPDRGAIGGPCPVAGGFSRRLSGGGRTGTPDAVADFLTRCLFCMFAEDVGLLPERSFTDLLNSLPADGSGFPELVEQLFREMNSGTGKGISIVLRKKLLQFNGGLFSDFTVLPVNGSSVACSKRRRNRTGAASSRPSSARCWNGR